MTALLFGASSMLGWSILQGAIRAERPVTAFCNGNTRVLPAGASERIDLDDEQAVIELFRSIAAPPLIIHCAGVCDVADCERSPEFAWAVNVDATRHLVTHAPAITCSAAIAGRTSRTRRPRRSACTAARVSRPRRSFARVRTRS